MIERVNFGAKRGSISRHDMFVMPHIETTNSTIFNDVERKFGGGKDPERGN